MFSKPSLGFCENKDDMVAKMLSLFLLLYFLNINTVQNQSNAM